MTTEFRLEIYYEHDSDQEFAQREKQKLCTLVSEIAPHIQLKTKVLKAKTIDKIDNYFYNGRYFNLRLHDPEEAGSQTLLITNDDVRAEGFTYGQRGCLDKQKMEGKQRRGENSADITIHEWLHTIAGKQIGGRILPCPDDPKGLEFECKDINGKVHWHYWYKYILDMIPDC